MTILVDEPRWHWRDVVWSHVVSDHSVDELHRFARSVGLRYLSFQSDHYDLPAPLFPAAIEAGATLVDSRVLIRRLRETGLRRRVGHRANTWSVIASGGVGEVSGRLESGRTRVLHGVVDNHGPVVDATLLERPGDLVALLDLADHRRRLAGNHAHESGTGGLVEAIDPRGHTIEVIWHTAQAPIALR